jgi:hypothetical protein
MRFGCYGRKDSLRQQSVSRYVMWPSTGGRNHPSASSFSALGQIGFKAVDSVVISR